MDQNNIVLGSESSEINIKAFLGRIWENKLYFLICVSACMAVAYLYTKYAPPTYEVATSLLMDVSASSRTIGTDQNSAEAIGTIDAEKNLVNEIGVIKSFNLIVETVDELGFDVSYHTKDGMKSREEYGYFPFEVVQNKSSSQAIDIMYNVEILSESEYRLNVNSNEFYVYNPVSKSSREVKQELDFSGTYQFGQEVLHDFFRFTINKPSYRVSMAEFKGIDLFFSLHSVEDLAQGYIDKLDVAQSDLQGSIIQMIIRGEVVQKEIDFLNALTKNYIQSQLNRRKSVGSGQIDYIRESLAQVGENLNTAERQLENYRRDKGAIDISRTATLSLDRINVLEGERGKLELNNLYYRSVLEELKDTSGINSVVMPSTQGINDPVLNDALVDLRKKYAERNRSAQFKGEKSMDIISLDKEIAQARQTIADNINSLVRQSELTLDEKSKQIGLESSKLSRLPSNERNLVKLERDRDSYSNTYNYLKQQLTKIEIAQVNEMPDTQVIDTPRMQGDGPVAPQKMLIYLLGLLVGIFIPLGFIVVSSSVSEHILTIDQIERYAGIPVASSIGHFGMDKYGKIIDEHKWKLVESFRDLSASLQFLLPNSQNNIIGVTSTIPGEGKTFCATNLGMIFAEGGKKILLVDTDLRNPSLVEDIERVKGKGLVNYLRGEIEFINEIIYEHEEIENLHYIPTYPIDGNPHKLLTSPKLKTILNDLRDEYDYIIFDSPPIGLVSDYLLISKYFDIHLFVVRRKYSKLQYLHDIDKIRQRGNLQNMYIIFNDVKDEAFKYGYNNYEYRDSRKIKDIKKKIRK